MKYVVSGTNRPGSRTRQVAGFIQKLYEKHGEQIGMIDLAELPLEQTALMKYGDTHSGVWGDAIAKVQSSSGLIFVIPEYNGSMPGILKLFVDYWKYPDAFENRPICLIGLGGMFGGLRPVEHLQHVLGYRNSFIFPQRIFLQGIYKSLENGTFKDPVLLQLFDQQCIGFQKFVHALETEGIDANSILKSRSLAT